MKTQNDSIRTKNGRQGFWRAVLPGLLIVWLGEQLLLAGARVSFPQGVASGDVTSDSAVLWTRVEGKHSVKVEVATAPEFRRVVFQSTVRVFGDDDYTVKEIATGLRPATRYYYRWRHGNALSDIGTFKTAPAPAAASGVFRFVFTGDSDGAKVNGAPFYNNFEVLDAARRENPDFFVYLGDTIYADERAAGLLPNSETLDDFRARYKENRGYSALRNLMEATSIYAIWDDHEVIDNFDPSSVDPALLANGRKAFLEYMPINEDLLQPDSGCIVTPFFRVFHWGKDVDIIILDLRSCRSPEATLAAQGDLAPLLPPPVRALFAPFLTANPPPGAVEAINDPSRTLLGARQKELLKSALLHSTAKFKFIINEDNIQQLFLLPYDSWEGYGADRKEILNFIRDNHISNVIFLTTDYHLNIIGNVALDRFADPQPIAVEFITGPIATVTSEQLTLSLFPPAIAPQALMAQHALYNLAGVECQNLNTYSYGLVEVDANAGTVRVTLKDQNGNVIHDQLNPGILCTKTITAP